MAPLDICNKFNIAANASFIGTLISFTAIPIALRKVLIKDLTIINRLPSELQNRFLSANRLTDEDIQTILIVARTPAASSPSSGGGVNVIYINTYAPGYTGPAAGPALYNTTPAAVPPSGPTSSDINPYNVTPTVTA
jgi:hypothetical protein